MHAHIIYYKSTCTRLVSKFGNWYDDVTFHCNGMDAEVIECVKRHVSGSILR